MPPLFGFTPYTSKGQPIDGNGMTPAKDVKSTQNEQYRRNKTNTFYSKTNNFDAKTTVFTFMIYLMDWI